tara:strand:+ start:1613 stop:1891 length:279 start_codon:yes stop_codon:yes gene_type:complete
MSDYERHEPMTRGEKREVEVEPHPDYFPSASDHAEDIMAAADAFATIVSLIDRGDITQAREYASFKAGLFENQLLNLYPVKYREEGRLGMKI